MNKDDWQNQSYSAAQEFGRRCRDLHKSNPFDHNALNEIVNTLMTELWDNGFSQSEIRSAFEKAVADMPRYAAGLERRSDGPH